MVFIEENSRIRGTEIKIKTKTFSRKKKLSAKAHKKKKLACKKLTAEDSNFSQSLSLRIKNVCGHG